MKKDFTTYEQALALKELGFDEECFAWYVSKEWGLEFGRVIKSDLIKDAVLAPTYSQALRWFRDNHNYHHTIQHGKKYVGVVYYSIVNFSIDEFDKYEEAESACLDKLIEIVKDK